MKAKLFLLFFGLLGMVVHVDLLLGCSQGEDLREQ